MQLLGRLIRHPQQIWIRRAIFQVHLWLGVALALYLVAIALTGSILVFRVELERLTAANQWPSRGSTSGPIASLTTVLSNVQAAYPGRPVQSVMAPTSTTPVFLAELLGRRGRITVAADPVTGAVLHELHPTRNWLTWVRDLHVTLLIGPKGRQLNGVGGALLLLINLSGLLIWWPGIAHWRRAMAVDFRRRWRRVNFDLHSAAGFWTLWILSIWAVSAVYFGWSREFFLFVNQWSPIINARPPKVTVDAAYGADKPPNLEALIGEARRRDPGTSLSGVEFPYNRRAPLGILLFRGNDVGREYVDTVYFHPVTGAFLMNWRYGVNESVGDWIIWSQVPLHYGTYWGLGIKVVWALLGLAVPVVATTGLIMYWFRVLRPRYRRLIAPTAATPA